MIKIHSFSKYGDKEVPPKVLKRLIAEGRVHSIKSKHGGREIYFFKQVKQ